MTYDDYKLMSDRESEGSGTCTHWCANNHPYIEHELDDAETWLRSCNLADEAQPDCETCAWWVWNLADGVSAAAEFSRSWISVDALMSFVKNIIAYPYPEICKHLVACDMLSLLESAGVNIGDDLASAVVQADDETAIELLNKKTVKAA